VAVREKVLAFRNEMFEIFFLRSSADTTKQMVYTQEFRNAAIAKYVEIGSYWKAAKLLNVSIATLHRWVRHKESEGEQPPQPEAVVG
jgi:transposase-like protein